MIKGKCEYPGCQADIKPAENLAQFNRNKGLHMLSVHGVPSQKRYIPVHLQPGHPKYVGDEKAKIAMASMPAKPAISQDKLDQLAKAREAKRAERERAKARRQSEDAKNLLLSQCPACGAEFMRRVGGKLQVMKLKECVTCNIQFWYTGNPIEQ